MANRDGAASVISLSRTICRIVRRYGAASLSTLGTPEIAAAVATLVVACQAFDALDDFPAEVDPNDPGA